MNFADLPSEQKQKLLHKLARLKALSECPTGNVNETATAAAAMTRLMLEYQIELAELGVEEPDAGVQELELFEEWLSRGVPIWQSIILSGLAEAHHCMTFRDRRTVGFNLSSFRSVNESQYFIVGAPEDTQQVKRLFLFCLEEIERLCREWNPKAKVTAKNDFRLGAGRGIVDKVQRELAEVIRQQAAGSAALVLFQAKLQAVEDHFATLGISSTSRSYRPPGASAFQEGYQAGSSIDYGGRGRLALGPGK